MKPIERRLDKLSSELCKLLARERCHACGFTGIDCHHIVSRNHRRLRWNQDNLVFLCRLCHRDAHDKNWTFGRELDRRVKIWSDQELEEMEKEIKLKIKELKNGS